MALQYAVDVPTICQTLLAFDCERASSMVNKPNDNANLTPYPYDPEMAKKLLDEAGYPADADGVRFEMGMMAGKGRYLNDVNVVQAIAQYLTDVGVKVNLQQMEWGSEFVPLLREHKVGPLFFVGTGGSTWSAVYDMSDISKPDAATNYTEWANPDWFAGWPQLAETRDPAAEKGDHRRDVGDHVQRSALALHVLPARLLWRRQRRRLAAPSRRDHRRDDSTAEVSSRFPSLRVALAASAQHL